MTPQRLSAKLFITNGSAFQPGACVPLFHQWIQRQEAGELLIDVADYTHVPEGPAVMLVGLEGEYVIDQGSGRTGIRYIRKRALPDELLPAILFTLSKTLAASVRIQGAIKEDIMIDSGEIEIALIDKLRYPNTPATFDALTSRLLPLAKALYGATGLTIVHVETDERLPLAVQIKTSRDVSLTELVNQLDTINHLFAGAPALL